VVDASVPLSLHSTRARFSGCPVLITPTDLQTVAEVLDETLPDARPETRRALVSSAEVRTFRARQTVVAQGDDTHIGLVLEGHVGLRRTTVDGRELIPLIASRGQLGPVLPIAGRPSSAELLGLSPGRIALWSSDDVQALAAQDAGFALALLKHVLHAVEEVVERMDGLLYQNAQRRVARVLDQHAEMIFGDQAVVTRSYLPALVGTSREMTGRVLRQLESDGVVERMGRGRLRLLDAARLARTAAPTREPDARNKFLVARASPMQE
jgi:CRP/FNR family cyclic AMP-dependent transcriptional regulator